MAKPKLAAKTPDEAERNSLIDSAQDLIDRPGERRFAVVELAVIDRTFPEHNDAYARVQLVHIEQIHGDDIDKVLAIRDAHYTKRTGNSQLPTVGDTPLDLSELDDEPAA